MCLGYRFVWLLFIYLFILGMISLKYKLHFVKSIYIFSCDSINKKNQSYFYSKHPLNMYHLYVGIHIHIYKLRLAKRSIYITHTHLIILHNIR